MSSTVTKANDRAGKINKKLSLVALATVGFLAGSVAVPIQAMAAQVRVLVQLNNYEGEKAYFSLYLVSPDARYEQTLWVSGDEEKYFPDLPRWWKYLSRKPQPLDAITGASTAGGDRSILKLEIADELIDAGYRLRVETAVEDLENYDSDVEVDLSRSNAGEKIPGTGYVRFISFKM